MGAGLKYRARSGLDQSRLRARDVQLADEAFVDLKKTTLRKFPLPRWIS